jgi:Domain of unknown function (DUF4350)
VRERLATLVCALGALGVFVTLFLHGQGLEEPRSAPPTTLERGDNGLRAAMLWLQAEGIRTLSLRERFYALARRRALPAQGNLLIVSTPVVTAFRLSEANALERWVRAGNTLLVLAALSDRPAWAAAGFVHGDLSLLTGLDFVLRERQPGETSGWPRAGSGRRARADEARALPGFLQLTAPLRSTLVANRAHPYFAGVGSAVALSDYLPQVWDVKLPRSGFVLSLAHQREMGEGALWVRPLGSGTVIVSAFGSLFTNRVLGLADNARLLANIVSATVAADGVVLFDDEHQGLGVEYDPAKFYRDPRLYATLGVVLAVWLTWVLGSTRLRLPPGRARAPREADLVRTTGVFLARVLQPAAAARRMFEHFFRRLQARSRSGTQAGRPPWQWLEQHPRLPRADVRQLREWYAAAYSERRVPLTRLHNLIVRTERQLAA